MLTKEESSYKFSCATPYGKTGLLEYVDWGYLLYFWADGTEVADCRVQVQWPDGARSVQRLRMIPYDSSYSDHGRTYEAETRRPAISCHDLLNAIRGDSVKDLKLTRLDD